MMAWIFLPNIAVDVSRHHLFLNANVWLQALVLLESKAVKAGKISRFAVSSPCCTILIYIPHLPRTKPKAKKLRAVSGVWVERK